MPVNPKRSAWAELLDGDIDWLLKQERTLERNHIIEVLRGLRRTGPVEKEAPDRTDDENRVVELYERGHTGPEIQDLTDLSRSKVYSILRSANVERRRTGARDGYAWKGGAKKKEDV